MSNIISSEKPTKAIINRPRGGYCTTLQEALESDKALLECFQKNIERNFMNAYDTSDKIDSPTSRSLFEDVAQTGAKRFLDDFIKGDLHD